MKNKKGGSEVEPVGSMFSEGDPSGPQDAPAFPSCPAVRAGARPSVFPVVRVLPFIRNDTSGELEVRYSL